MGLDITAYQGLVPVREATRADAEEERYYDEGLVRLRPNDDFPNHHGAIEPNTIYSAQETFRFRAGSYGGYNQWRKQLAALVGIADIEAFWAKPTDGPFSELIHFSDCEGIVGPEVSAKLARDFAEWQDRADAHEDPWFCQQYANWRRAFGMAASAGAVRFS